LQKEITAVNHILDVPIAPQRIDYIKQHEITQLEVTWSGEGDSKAMSLLANTLQNYIASLLIRSLCYFMCFSINLSTAFMCLIAILDVAYMVWAKP